MNKKENKKKMDIEAKLFMALLHLKEEKNKNYSIEECEKNIVYLFDNYDEFKYYFELNGFANIDKDLLELCRMKTTKKGTVIALKGLCDHAIRKHNSTYQDANVSSKEKQKFDASAVACDRTFVVSPDKKESFLNIKPKPEIRRQQEEMVKRLNINNLVEEGLVLKKTRKPNR